MAKFNVNDTVKFTVDLPKPGDELYGYLHFASPGDIGKIVAIQNNDDEPVYIVKLANVNLRIVDESFITKAETDADDRAYHIVLAVDGIMELPIFTEMMGEQMVDFAKIIPIPSEDTSLKELWGCDTNSNDTMILDDHTVSFSVTGGIPEKVAAALSAMVPDVTVYMGAMIVTDNAITQYLYMNGRLAYRFCGSGTDVSAMTRNKPLTHVYNNGVTLARLVNTLRATTNTEELMSYAVYGSDDKRFRLIIDHDAKRIYLNPMEIDDDAADGQSVDDDDDVMIPDNHESVGIPITDATKDVRCVEDVDD